MTCFFSGLDASGSRPLLSRRQWLQSSAAGAIGVSLTGWLKPLAAAAASNPQRRRSCILLWMDGGPSQMDTFDLKPGHANGGPFKEIATSVPGIKICEHLPRVATWMKHMAIIRSMNTRLPDHILGTYLMHTGYFPQGGLKYPPLGALVSHELGRADAVLPNFVNIAPSRHYAPEVHTAGFLGAMHAPLILGGNAGAVLSRDETEHDEALKMPYLLDPASSGVAAGMDDRISMLQQMDRAFVTRYPGKSGRNHQAAYERAVRLMRSEAVKAYDFKSEPAKVREAYGQNLFGQGCLIARRLVERGVPFVEVTLGGYGKNVEQAWDTHDRNFDTVKKLSQILDPAWSSLMRDLQERGLLETTLILWMGEFGRTPKINAFAGRDHFASAWSTVLAGGGIRGGQVIGKTSADGTAVEERTITATDFFATIYLALGMDPQKSNISNTGRPIPLVDENAQPIQELLA